MGNWIWAIRCEFWCVAPSPFGPITYHDKGCRDVRGTSNGRLQRRGD